jgi:hypothetical protein
VEKATAPKENQTSGPQLEQGQRRRKMRYGRQGLQIWEQEPRQDKQTSSTQNEDQKDWCLVGKISTGAGIETALVGVKQGNLPSALWPPAEKCALQRSNPTQAENERTKIDATRASGRGPKSLGEKKKP